MPQAGFLGTNAPWTADAILLLELILGLGLIAGAILARAGRYRLHAVCQSVIVLLNLAVIRPSDASGLPSPSASETAGQGWQALLRDRGDACGVGRRC